MFNGGLSDSATLRDYNPHAFLTSLIWATQGERPCFQFGPADNQAIMPFVAGDPNAQVSIIAGGWALGPYRAERRGELIGDALRKEVARLQRVEMKQLNLMRASWVKAKVRIWTLAEFLDAPMENLAPILDEITPRSPRRPTEAPQLSEMEDFGGFVQRLKNEGMHLHLVGDFPAGDTGDVRPGANHRPVLAR